MKNISDRPDIMVELLDSCPDLEFNQRGIEIINEIADYAEQTKLFKENKERCEIFDEKTAKNIFYYMLDRVVNAPTELHRDSSVILIMPFVRKKLNEEMSRETDDVKERINK